MSTFGAARTCQTTSSRLSRSRTLGALRRKITYVINPQRINTAVYLHPIEGWTTAQILDFMVAEGLDRARLEDDIQRGRARLDQRRTLVNED